MWLCWLRFAAQWYNATELIRVRNNVKMAQRNKRIEFIESFRAVITNSKIFFLFFLLNYIG